MNRIDKVKELLRLARVFDAAYQMTLLQEKDNNPDHWKTINGAHVHVDENGDYDGGAGGLFNGKHHYGKGYKEKRKETAVKELRSLQKGHHQAEYVEGESFEDWQRRDDIDYDKDGSKGEKKDILFDLARNWKNLYKEERTPENLVKRINEQYEELTKELEEDYLPEEKEYDYPYNPLVKEAEQRKRWESMKREYEYSQKKAEEAKKKNEEHRNKPRSNATEGEPF